MKKSIKLILLLFVIILFVKCTDVPLSYNTKSTIPELNGFFQYGDSTIAQFEVTKDNNVRYSGYELLGGKFQLKSTESDLLVFFTDIKHKGIVHHFISIKIGDEMFMTKKIELVNKNIVVTSLNDSFLSKEMLTSYESADKFKQFIKENIGNKLLFEERQEVYKKVKSL